MLIDVALMQSLRNSGVPLPAAAGKAADCATALTHRAALSDPAAQGADDDTWLAFKTAMEAAGALEAENSSASAPGKHPCNPQRKTPMYSTFICILPMDSWPEKQLSCML